jgi:hypothetical protein
MPRDKLLVFISLVKLSLLWTNRTVGIDVGEGLVKCVALYTGQ